MVKGQPYDYRADVWCLGVLLVEMLFGQLPFAADKNRDYTQSIMNLEFKLPTTKQVSTEARDLIKSILVPQTQRLHMKDLYEHPWLKKTFENHERI